MNCYIQVQFKYLCGQPAALEICVILLDGKLSLLTMPALLEAFLSCACEVVEASWNTGDSD